ncbi:hypothetical protein GCM10025791_04150 [Halioxenophilus aromaticivorans]|uniref:Uncharacterized protein n=2 Tax=Halioxenophilus aromaticivorans TaxID=1306992 RepID=A0AAV3TXT3_9ALTE
MAAQEPMPIRANTNHHKPEINQGVSLSEVNKLVESQLQPMQGHLNQQQLTITKLAQQIEQLLSANTSTKQEPTLSEEQINEQLEASAQEQRQAFADQELLFELEEHDKSATSELASALADMENRVAVFNLNGLELGDAECRGTTCRLQLNFNGDEAALEYLPALLAASGHSQVSFTSEKFGEGYSITALLN